MAAIDFKRKPKADNTKNVISNASTYAKSFRDFLFNHSLWGIFAIFVAAVLVLVVDIQHFNSVQSNTDRIDEIVKENKLPKIDSKTIDTVQKLKDTPTGNVSSTPAVNNRANPFDE